MKRRYILLAMMTTTLQAACGSVPVERFYSLDALEPAAGEVASQTIQRLYVAPVRVPEALDRPQMVWRVGPRQLVIAEQSRWAEPLPSAIGRVVADNLARQLPGVLPVSPHTEADTRIELDIRRLDAELGRVVTLDVVWTIRRSTGMTQGRALKRETVTGTAIEDLVAAHERVLLSLSQDIATNLSNQPH